METVIKGLSYIIRIICSWLPSQGSTICKVWSSKLKRFLYYIFREFITSIVSFIPSHCLILFKEKKNKIRALTWCYQLFCKIWSKIIDNQILFKRPWLPDCVTLGIEEYLFWRQFKRLKLVSVPLIRGSETQSFQSQICIKNKEQFFFPKNTFSLFHSCCKMSPGSWLVRFFQPIQVKV